MPDSFPKRVTLLGSTGSIGTQALDVIRSQPGKFTVTALSAHSNAELLIQQAREFRPAAVVIGDEAKYETVKAALASQPETEVLAGAAALADVAGRDDADVVLTAMVGYAGLLPTVRAIRADARLDRAEPQIRAAHELGFLASLLLGDGVAHAVQAELPPAHRATSALMRALSGPSAMGP